jgi:8-oxo-dGTP diphosphatase
MIRKIGLLVVRENRLLLCRKCRGTTLLILPGGKPEGDETEERALEREIAEELGTTVSAIEHCGRYEDEAAGDPRRVSISLYTGVLAGEPVASGEIAELIWFGAGDDTGLISPSLQRQILPDLLRRGILR